VRWLVDTNVLLRGAQASHPMYGVVSNAVEILRTRHDDVYVIGQNLVEFWAVATRPIANNGLGVSISEAEQELIRLKLLFGILPDTPEVFDHWEKLVVEHQVIGKQAHDTRLVAAMLVHHLTHLLTFNDRDFKRFTEVTVRNPKEITEE